MMEPLECLDWETATPASFQDMEISTHLVNRLEIKIVFSSYLSLALVLTLESQLNHFEKVFCVIFEATDWEYPTITATLFWISRVSNIIWVSTFCVSNMFLTLTIYNTGRQFAEHQRFHIFYTNTLVLRMICKWLNKFQSSGRKMPDYSHILNWYTLNYYCVESLTNLLYTYHWNMNSFTCYV